MPELRLTFEDLDKAVTLATGARHTIILPPFIYRVRLIGILFETDKTFILPSALPGLRRLKEIYDGHVGKTVLVSGHADRAGAAAHNLVLSVERAKSVAAFLQDDVGDWVPRYDAGVQRSTRWGTREDQYMLSSVVAGDGSPYFGGALNSRLDGPTKASIKRFRTDAGLSDGPMDATARRQLIQKYMATDGTTLPVGTTIVTHGCGESHPSVATADSVALAENRRVELFFFKGPVKPPAVDPCPSGACAEYPEWVRRTIRTIDVNSEPEVAVLIVDELGLPMRNAPVELVLPGGARERVSTDANGRILTRVAPGTTFDIVISDVHEGGPQDSLTTSSGQHFETGGTGPEAPP